MADIRLFTPVVPASIYGWSRPFAFVMPLYNAFVALPDIEFVEFMALVNAPIIELVATLV